MTECRKCGARLEGEKKCPVCGASVDGLDVTELFQNVLTGSKAPEYVSENDIKNNKVFAAFSYWGPLVLIPLLAAPKSRFARIHANQGLILFIAAAAYNILKLIVDFVLGFIPFIGWLVSSILSIGNVLFLIAAVLGTVKAAQGSFFAVPFIGKYKLIK